MNNQDEFESDEQSSFISVSSRITSRSSSSSSFFSSSPAHHHDRLSLNSSANEPFLSRILPKVTRNSVPSFSSSSSKKLQNSAVFSVLREDGDDDENMAYETNPTHVEDQHEEFSGHYSHPPQWAQLSCMSAALLALKFYLLYALREMRKRKFNCCLGTFSCFLVVLVTATAQTMLSRAPVIFLQQGEDQNGQFDFSFHASSGIFYNFSSFEQLGRDVSPEYSFTSPRYSFPSLVYPKQCISNLQHFGQFRGLPGWDLPAHVGTELTTPSSSFPSSVEAFASFNNDILYAGCAINGVEIHTNATTERPDSQPLPYWDPAQFHCTNRSSDCLHPMCARKGIDTPPISFDLRLIDTTREVRMGLGRAWPFAPLAPQQAIITDDIRFKFNVTVGDTLLIRVTNFNSFTTPLFDQLADIGVRRYNAEQATDQTRLNRSTTGLLADAIDAYTHTINLPVTVVGVLDDFKGKYGNEDSFFMVMEYEHFLETLYSHAAPLLRRSTDLNDFNLTDSPASVAPLPKTIIEFMRYSNANLYTLTRDVVCNLPPNDRLSYYMTTNYDDIQRVITQFGAKLCYALGFPYVSVQMGLIEKMSALKYFALYSGIILSVILTILILLSVMLIYSLLMISVETRQFEIGIQRMVGITRRKIIQLVLVQACLYAIPAWALGLIFAQLISSQLLDFLASTVDMPLDHTLTPFSIRSASLLGLLIPLVSAILPIRSALNRNLLDSLDTRHSKTQGVSLSIERSEESSFRVAWLAAAIAVCAFGLVIYYLLPLSLLSFDLVLFFNIFFGVLLGMFFGLILLSLNVQHIIERVVVLLFFFWEKRSISKLIVKNLEAHRMRNRKTTIMYALTVGVIIFINVAYTTEIKSAELEILKTNGGWMSVYSRYSWWPVGYNTVQDFEAVLRTHSVVEDWGWRSVQLAYNDDSYDDTQISNQGHVFEHSAIFVAVTPNYLEITFQEFLTPSLYDGLNGLSFSEQLYTGTGSQGGLLGTMFTSWLGNGGLNTPFLFLGQRHPRSDAAGFLNIQQLKSLAFFDSAPGELQLTQFTTNKAQAVVVSFHTLMRVSRGSFTKIEDVPMSRLVLKIKPDATNSALDALKSDLRRIADGVNMRIFDYRDFSFQIFKTNFVMDLIFGIATFIAMFLCLFSLMASMYTNILEQAKEIAVLRALGMTTIQIIRLYIYEAFALTVAASLTGCASGAILGSSMVANRGFLTQMPIPFLFPWTMVAWVLGAAVLCGFLASYFPARTLNRKAIASIFRTLL